MTEKTNDIQPKRRAPAAVDDKDRTILSEMQADADLSYAELGERVHLSAPAVHERVKKLRASGVIKRKSIELDGEKVGRPLLAFVSVTLAGGSRSPRYPQFHDDPDIEEVHSVAGKECLLLKVRCSGTEGLQALLERIHDVGNVVATNSTIVLTSYFERGPQADVR